MKSLLSVFFILLATCSTTAQDLRVSVHDQNGPLPYANVYVNEVQVAITDSLGRTTLSELKVGDIVSSSYIGMQPAAATYDGTMRECVLTHLEERTYAVGEVSVSALDGSGWKAFRKYARPDDPPFFNCIVDGRFEADLAVDESASRFVAGSFTIENRLPKEGWKAGEFWKHHFNLPAQIETHDDTVHIGGMLSGLIPTAFGNACQFIDDVAFANHHRIRPHSGMSYLGQEQGAHHFRFVYSSPKLDYNFQILITVDESSKKITTIRYRTTHEQSDGWFSTWIVSVDCAPYTSRKPRKQTIAPTHITWQVDQPNLVMKLTLSDLTIRASR